MQTLNPQRPASRVRQYLIERKSPRTGFTERQLYEGPKRYKPKGWRIVSEA